ncbi:MAG: hypothetical protein ACYC09_07270 [Bacteroidota bacterium]
MERKINSSMKMDVAEKTKIAGISKMVWSTRVDALSTSSGFTWFIINAANPTIINTTAG